MRLRESLSSKDSPLEKLVLRGIDECIAAGSSPDRAAESTALPHRVNRKLRTAELVALYESGVSMLELSRRFGAHRHTVARHLERAGIEVRAQKKMTPELLDQARAHDESGHTLAEIGELLGLEASTIGKALKRAGVRLRPPVADKSRGYP